MWPGPSWAEKIIRPLFIYMILLIIFRVANKREMAQATLFDFLIILLISNVVQNAMIGDDNSILGASAGAVTLVLLSAILNRITARSRKARRMLEGQPVLLVDNGERHCAQRSTDRDSQARHRADGRSGLRGAGVGRQHQRHQNRQ